MKKVIVFIFYIALFIGSIFSTSSYTIKGKINASYSQFINDPDYNIVLSCLEDNSITEIDGSVYVKQGIEIKIEYKNAALVGGGPTGSVNIKTKVQKDNIDILNESTFIIQEGETSEIKIIQTGSSESLLHSIKLIGVKEILSNGEFLYVKDLNKIIKASGDTYRFELSGTEILLINKNNKNWWVNENSILNIIELKGSGSGNGSGGASQDENGNYVGHTYYTFESYSPKIEGEFENFQNQLKVKSDIKLIIEHRTGGSGLPDNISSSVVLNIYVDKENPTASKTIKDECEKINNVWKNEDIIIILKDSEDDCGIEFYEYSIDGKEWVKAKEFTTEDQIVFDETVYFRAVDFFGKKSPIQECKVRVDKSKPEIISSGGQNEDIQDIQNWAKGEVEVTAKDTGSGLKTIGIYGIGEEGEDSIVIKENGIYTVVATDNVGNSREVIIAIDNEKPVIKKMVTDTELSNENWTNKDVKITFRDDISGIKEWRIKDSSGNIVRESRNSEEREYKIKETGIYRIIAVDNAGNEAEEVIKIDKKKPVIKYEEDVFSDFIVGGSGAALLESYNINYIVEENESGIKSDSYCIRRYFDNKEYVSANIEKTGNVISIKEESVKGINRKEDKEIKYKITVEDEAGNKAEEKEAVIVIPKQIIIKAVSKEKETEEIRQSDLKDGYTTAGMLINKIDFEKYKYIKIERTFFDKEEKAIDIEKYKSYFLETEDERKIVEKWNKHKFFYITVDNVKAVEIDGAEYWYYEDKIETASGLGHKKIRYQAEWEWKAEPVIEKGEFSEVEKTANNPGKMKIRIKGTDAGGREIRYIVLDSHGKKIEGESAEDFRVPVNGIVELSFKIEDEDAEEYNIQAREIVIANFRDENGEEKPEEITIPLEGKIAEGYIKKTIPGGSYRQEEISEDGWYRFKASEIKLHYNKPYSMKITVTEGSEKTEDSYETAAINLIAENPDRGGFTLTVDPSAGYNKDGITTWVNRNISLGINTTEVDKEITGIEWDFGDNSEKKIENSTSHIYKQSENRTGNISEYKLRISLTQDNSKKTAEIPVYVVDTQYGNIDKNEVWIGKHPVVGKIQIRRDAALIIRENERETENPTMVLGMASAISIGEIEITENGKLIVERGNERILFTEGTNGEEYQPVITQTDEVFDNSYKWKGITVNSDGEVSLEKADISFAETGLTVKGNKTVLINDIEISDCAECGINNEGSIKITGGLKVIRCNEGVRVSEKGKFDLQDNIVIKNVKKGLINKGRIVGSEEDIKIESIKETGIIQEGELKIKNLYLIAETEGKEGIENQGRITSGGEIKVEYFDRGITNNGSINVTGTINIIKSCTHGIRNKGSVEGKNLYIENIGNRAVICGDGSICDFIEVEVKCEKSEIGIHAVGNARIDIDECSVNNAEYGIKTDRNEAGKGPDVSINNLDLSDVKIKWYDWKEGILEEF